MTAKPETAKHTPGPWNVEMSEEGKWFITSDGHLVGGSHSGSGRAKQDAFLMAAAPELLQACKLLVAWETGADVGEMTSDKVIAIGRAAIAKAEGNPQ